MPRHATLRHTTPCHATQHIRVRACRDAYDLCIWTAAPSDYMHAIIAGIDSVLPGFKQDLALAFSEEEAEFAWQGRAVTTKDLRKVASRAVYSYGLYSYGLYSYGLGSLATRPAHRADPCRR